MKDKFKMTFDYLMETIENYIDNKIDLGIVCEEDLADEIVEYCIAKFDFDEISVDCDSDEEDYLVSIRYIDNELCLFCESLYDINDNIKEDESEGNYYIFSDIPVRELMERFYTSGAFIVAELDTICDFCEQYESECNCEIDEDCDCKFCDECDGEDFVDIDINLDYSAIEELRLIIEFTNKILQANGQYKSTVDAIIDLFDKGKELGKQDALLEIQNYTEHMMES